MRIHLLSPTKKRRCHSFLYPLRVFKRHIHEAGLSIRVFQDPETPGLADCDVLGIIHDSFPIQELISADGVARYLESIRKRVQRLIWFDISDGTGQLMPFCFDTVDIYAKKQLLVDRSIYSQTFYEREYHLDYYYRNYYEQLEPLGTPARIVNQRGLTEIETEKLALCWNIGLGDYKTFAGRGRSLRRFWPFASFAKPTSMAQQTDRDVQLSYRVGTNYHAPGVPFHRLEIRKRFNELLQQEASRKFQLEGVVNYRQYVRELDCTQIGPSPFGLGEICWRDFEVWLSGAMLLKPDMSHMETWPNYFESNVTYATHAWDFSDLKQVVEELLDDEQRRVRIAEVGQQRYLQSLSDESGVEFAERLRSLVVPS